MRPFISARDRHDLALSGEGTIDGNGKAWWERVRGARAKDPIKHDDAAPRPHLIVFDRCQRVRLSGVKKWVEWKPVRELFFLPFVQQGLT